MFNIGGGSGFGRGADLFFTRRIGLSEFGTPIPIIGGARLTGKTGRHNIAAMNITTGDFGDAGENFFRGALQPRHPGALQGRRPRHQQAGGGRRALQPARSRPTRRWPSIPTSR